MPIVGGVASTPSGADTRKFAVTVPAMVWVSGKLEMETTLPLTAEVIFEIAVKPKETTVWATICSPPVTTEESVVAD